MDLLPLITFVAGAGIGTAAGMFLSRNSEVDISGTVDSLQREKELTYRELLSTKKELDRLLAEREELVRKYEEELLRKNRHLQAQLAENKRLADALELLKLEKKRLEIEVSTLESSLKSSIPKDLVKSVAKAEKILDQVRDFLLTRELHNYRLLTSDEHDQVFSRIFAEEEKVFLTSPFITEDAVNRRLPEIKSFLERGGKLFLVIGREWNTVKFGDEGLVTLMREISDGDAKVFADNIHHKLLIGDRTAVITSYNFLSKNNRLREVGIEVDDEKLAASLVSLEIENLKNSQMVRKITYARFRVLKVEFSTSGKTYRVETDSEELPKIYFPLEIEPKEGASYEAVVSSKMEGNFTSVIACRQES